MKMFSKSHGSRTRTTRELLGMANQQVFFCDQHLKRMGLAFTMEHYIPQTQARHTVTYRKFLTRLQLETFLAIPDEEK